jgi:hypothetical protein
MTFPVHTHPPPSPANVLVLSTIGLAETMPFGKQDPPLSGALQLATPWVPGQWLAASPLRAEVGVCVFVCIYLLYY